MSLHSAELDSWETDPKLTFNLSISHFSVRLEKFVVTTNFSFNACIEMSRLTGLLSASLAGIVSRLCRNYLTIAFH